MTWMTRPAIASGAQRKPMLESPSHRPPRSHPATSPTGIAQRRNTSGRACGQDLPELDDVALQMAGEEWLDGVGDTHLAAGRVDANPGNLGVRQLAKPRRDALDVRIDPRNQLAERQRA